MRLVSVLLMLGLFASVALAAPGGDNEEKPFIYPDGYFADRDTYAEVEPNEPCGSDQQVACGDVIDPGCIDISYDYDWYAFEVQEGIGITCGTDASEGLPTVDTYLELYADDCATQLTYDDDGGPGTYSLISDFVAPYTGTYHLLVRAYSSGTGCYMAFIDCEVPPPPPENDTCEGAVENGYSIMRCSAGTLTGDTSEYNADYSPANGCTGYSQAAGPDAVYYMDLEAGDICDFNYTYIDYYDQALYILTDCGDMNSCVVGADDPEEIFGWEVPETGRYYLILDGYSSSAAGTWNLDYVITCPSPPIGACCFGEEQCTELTEDECMQIPDYYLWIPDEICDPNPCPPVATENHTWGQIKANYR